MRSSKLSSKLGTASKRIRLGGACSFLWVVLHGLVLPAFAQSTNSAAYIWTTFAGTAGAGSIDNVGGYAQFSQPAGVAVDTNGNVYVADTDNDTIRKISPAGLVSTIAGFAGIAGSADGVNGAARFFGPAGIAVDGLGNLFVTDSGNNTIRKITPSGTNWVVSTMAGNNSIKDQLGEILGGSTDGTGTNALFNQPQGIAADNAGNVYVADTQNYTIRKLTPAGTNWQVTTIAGSAGNQSFEDDGMNTNAGFGEPFGIAVDSAGVLYVADSGNSVVCKIVHSGPNWVVTTIAGTSGDFGTRDGTGAAAQFDFPQGIGVDNLGNLYVSDQAAYNVRKITPTNGQWVASTLAGMADTYGSADGTGTNALFGFENYALLEGLAVDISGNVYIGDTGNNEIRKVTSAGVVTTLAGMAGSSGSVDSVGGAARFNHPNYITVDHGGNLYVTDSDNDTIRKITSEAEVTTLAGSVTNSGKADGTGGNARFDDPYGIVVDNGGNLYVADQNNDVIRKITPSGVVSTIAGSAGVHGSSDGSNSVARFYYPSGVTVDVNSNLYVSDTGNNTIRLIKQAGTNWAVTTFAGSAGHSGFADGTTAARFYMPYGLTMDSASNLYVADYYYATIRKITPAGLVSTIAGQAGNYGGDDGTGTNALFYGPTDVAADGAGNIYVADVGGNTIRKLTPAGTNWLVTTIGGNSSITDQFGNPIGGSKDGAGGAALFNNPQGLTVDGAGVVYVADRINNTIRKGVFSAYAPVNLAHNLAAMNGALSVVLTPPEAGGQWRFPWEQSWHNSGDIVASLAQDNYTIEFRSVPGYLTIQTNFIVAVTNGGTTSVTNQYYATVNASVTGGTGSLTVNIGPNSPAGSGWRFFGEIPWRAPGDTVTNLLPDIYYIEFEPVSGRSQPSSEAVQILAGLPVVVSANYLLSAARPAQVLLPFPVPASEVGDVTNHPFGFNGQLQSDVGFGSGVAVQANVVLTAAHLVFNDQTLSYVSQIYWYFQRETGTYEPEPQAARGWYVLSGYASERTNDLQSGQFGPDQSTPQSRNLDVAALYFLSPMAGGGYGGYLPSDKTANEWLAGNSLKMLAGYPVDGSIFGDASIVPGVMYQTDPQPYALTLSADPLDDQEVYTAPWFLSYPGNSGGPVYVQFNGYYYPAGVYLGTAFTGSQPSASLVRAIDSAVVNLITNAVALGDNGTNNSGGGVITIIPSLNTSASHPGYLILQLGPPSAVQAGAAWKLTNQPANFYSTANPSMQQITNTNALVVEFKPVPGWNLPTNRSVTVIPGVILTNLANYTVTNPVLTLDLLNGLRMTGTTNTTYQIQSNSSLTGTWIPFKTNTLTNVGFNLITNHAQPGFYRVLWLTNSP